MKTRIIEYLMRCAELGIFLESCFFLVCSEKRKSINTVFIFSENFFQQVSGNILPEILKVTLKAALTKFLQKVGSIICGVEKYNTQFKNRFVTLPKLSIGATLTTRNCHKIHLRILCWRNLNCSDPHSKSNDCSKITSSSIATFFLSMKFL